MEKMGQYFITYFIMSLSSETDVQFMNKITNLIL